MSNNGFEWLLLMIRTLQYDLTYTHTHKQKTQTQTGATENTGAEGVQVSMVIIMMRKRRRRIVVKRAIHTCS